MDCQKSFLDFIKQKCFIKINTKGNLSHSDGFAINKNNYGVVF